MTTAQLIQLEVRQHRAVTELPYETGGASITIGYEAFSEDDIELLSEIGSIDNTRLYETDPRQSSLRVALYGGSNDNPLGMFVWCIHEYGRVIIKAEGKRRLRRRLQFLFKHFRYVRLDADYDTPPELLKVLRGLR